MIASFQHAVLHLLYSLATVDALVAGGAGKDVKEEGLGYCSGGHDGGEG